ncbi:MAG: hypothetical protein ACP5HG_07880 [Anaerolineae bacterium]|jgi:hypothetical protein
MDKQVEEVVRKPYTKPTVTEVQIVVEDVLVGDSAPGGGPELFDPYNFFGE